MRIVVALSGGVDSSVAALELKKKGHEVIGMTMKTWPKEECGTSGKKMCCSLEGVQYARSIAEDIGMPFYVVDLSKEFAEIVGKYFMKEYAGGRTPNPCVYCNSRLKFGYLLDKARQLGADKIATGHYARIKEDGGDHFLMESSDKKRDQSYFLYGITRDVLPFIEFPLSELGKEDVRCIAAEHGLMTADRESSQDICFGSAEGGYKEYLKSHGVNAFTSGDILDIKGKVVGKHKGIATYTPGQRRGISIAMPEPIYVLKIDTANNTITVGGREHAMRKKIRVTGFNWLLRDGLTAACEFDTRIRYNGDKKPAVVSPASEDEAIVEFREPRFAPAPGQAAVFYDGEVVAGGAWIEEIIE